MTEREKLTNLLNQNCGYVDEQPASELANHLLENGVILPPIKVGQSIWTAEPFKDNIIREGWITVIMVDKNGFCGFWVDFGEIPLSAEYMDIDVGETVFLTREEAEEALKRKDKKSHK